MGFDESVGNDCVAVIKRITFWLHMLFSLGW